MRDTGNRDSEGPLAPGPRPGAGARLGRQCASAQARARPGADRAAGRAPRRNAAAGRAGGGGGKSPRRPDGASGWRDLQAHFVL